mmetsp:Transcript_26813/g.48372  ORF Transcript_26813/g.48372 Transcript_26813/m.48372 type:complete len:240 (-) Transcript_26813:33-752(-)
MLRKRPSWPGVPFSTIRPDLNPRSCPHERWSTSNPAWKRTRGLRPRPSRASLTVPENARRRRPNGSRRCALPPKRLKLNARPKRNVNAKKRNVNVKKRRWNRRNARGWRSRGRGRTGTVRDGLSLGEWVQGVVEEVHQEEEEDRDMSHHRVAERKGVVVVVEEEARVGVVPTQVDPRRIAVADTAVADMKAVEMEVEVVAVAAAVMTVTIVLHLPPIAVGEVDLKRTLHRSLDVFSREK